MGKRLTRIIAEFFYINHAVLTRHMRGGIPFEEIYTVLSDPDKPRREKKRYLFDLPDTIVSQAMKINIWERFMGDKGFVNTPLYNSQYKGSVEDFVGGDE